MKNIRKKSGAKVKASSQAKDSQTAQPVLAPARTLSPSESMEMLEMVAPSPEVLELAAEEEPNRRFLRDYFGVIRRLREKGFSFREIAEWLVEKGVVADHNAVYRVYTSKMSPLDAEDEARREQEEAEDAADQQ